MVFRRYSIVVVGAGPVGLAASWRLASKGHQVTVYERRQAFDNLGGDIQVSPNGTLLCRRTGLAPLLEEVANPRHDLVIHDNDAEMSTIMDVPIDLGDKVPSMMFRRADLQRRLYDIAIEAGVQVHMGQQVVAVKDSPARPALTFANGEGVSADIIVAADGVRSTIRTLTFPDRDTQPIALKEVCFQWNVPYSTLAEDPATLKFWEEGKRCCGLVVSSGSYLTYWSNTVRQEMFLIFTKTDYSQPVEVGAWNKPADPEEIQRLFQDYPRPIRTLVAKCVQAEHWRITDSVKGADWATPGGRIVLVGDAKHSMPPHQAQGLGQGLEDVMALAEFVDAAASTDDLRRVLSAFGAFRAPRVERILQAARANAAAFCLPPGEARQSRDAGWRNFKPTTELVSAWKNASTSWEDVNSPLMGNFSLLKWIQTYDVLQESQLYISQHLGESRL